MKYNLTDYKINNSNNLESNSEFTAIIYNRKNIGFNTTENIVFNKCILNLFNRLVVYFMFFFYGIAKP